MIHERHYNGPGLLPRRASHIEEEFIEFYAKATNVNDLRDAQVRALEERAAQLSAELERLRAESAASTEHRQREAQLQRSMLASLQAERAGLIEELLALKAELQSLGADSARVAVRRSLVMLWRAAKRRLGFRR